MRATIMKSRLAFLLFYCGLLIPAPATASDTTRVLFIGNSFTYVNMVPDIIKGLAQQGNIPMRYAMHAPGGATVGDLAQGTYAHMENPEVYNLIRQGNWDYVVLQDNQGRFIREYGVFSPSARTIEGHKRIQDSTLHYNPCATMIWFSGWAFKSGAPPYGNTGIELMDRIDANYKFMNDSLHQIIAPIGSAWKRSVIANPGVDLWDADEAHASLSGSYLTAAVLFSSIFKRDPGPLASNSGLSAAQAAEFRRIAYETFIDSFARDNEEAFTLPLSYTAGALVTTGGYTSYEYYKDGALIATTAGNSYTTTANGCFQVIAKTSNGCYRRSRQLCLQPTSLSEVAKEENIFRVYPNPARDYVMLSGNDKKLPVWVTMYDLQGRQVYHAMTKEEQYRVDLSGLAPGSYFIRIQTLARSWKTTLVVVR